MSLATRIIPCLDVSNGRVVKGINFKNLVDAGDPVEMARIYSEEGADEITFLDISASVEDRKTTLDVVSATADEVFIPLTVGGGISSVFDVDQLLRAGADKISVNTAAIKNPNLINEISERFGAQVLVISIDAKRGRTESGFEVTTHGGRNSTGIDAFTWIEEAISRGVGEILLNSMDMDGTRAGYDLELIRRVREISSVPVIASGGAGDLDDFGKAIESGADALLAASVFHFGIYRISDIKRDLSRKGFTVRQNSTLRQN
ncbi:MAG: imidazole glycerol phosphate synthase subunit HisF [Candidatus Nanopelagicaceae bacterium]|nr:imidazole glycerol phosphate synthase subunit HisF [Candidatus Nanopelagicaceae bacterium]